MKLYHTPKSHFARKDRILIDALALDVKLVDVGNVAEQDPKTFANNPMMKVPNLLDGKQMIFESDHIAAYLVRKFDPADQFKVLTDKPELLNARAVLNGVMATEVELIMAERTGINIHQYTRFDKFRKTIEQGMVWLENKADYFEGHPSYQSFHLVCLWDHLALYQMFELNFPKLKSVVERLSQTDYVSNSTPL